MFFPQLGCKSSSRTVQADRSCVGAAAENVGDLLCTEVLPGGQAQYLPVTLREADERSDDFAIALSNLADRIDANHCVWWLAAQTLE